MVVDVMRGGAFPDLPDSRDYRFQDSRLAVSSGAAPRVHFLAPLPEVRQQGNRNSCVAYACVSARELLARIVDGTSESRFSPQYLYYRGRELAGTLPSDSGLQLRDGMKALARWGTPYEDGYTGDDEAPGDLATQWALRRRIYAYFRIERPDEDREKATRDIKLALLSYHPVVISFLTFLSGEPFPTPLRLENGIATMPRPGDPPAFGHAVVVVGYNDPSGVFLCINSWGTAWGIGGKFYLPYRYLNDFGLDAWVMVG